MPESNPEIKPEEITEEQAKQVVAAKLLEKKQACLKEIDEILVKHSFELRVLNQIDLVPKATL